MSLLDVTGVVLNRRDVREDSRLYTILTHERGKLEVFGRGIRKGRAKLGGHLEPGATVCVTLAQGKTGETITAVERQHYPTRAMQDLSHLASLGFTLALLDAVTKPEAADAPLASFAQEALVTLENLGDEPDDHSRYRMWGTWHALGLTGHGPELDRCVHCRAPLVGNVRYSARLGGWLDEKCATIDPGAHSAPAATRESVRLFVRQPWSSQPVFPPDREVEQATAEVTRQALDHVIERRLGAERFVQFTKGLS